LTSENQEVYNQALYDMFNEAIKAYSNIARLTSTAASWDRESTIKEMVQRVLAAQSYILDNVEAIIKLYIVSVTVAGKNPNEQKTRLLLRSARRLIKLADRIKATASGSKSDHEIAEIFTKELVSRSKRRIFYLETRELFKDLLKRSKELMEESSNNLTLIGVLPRRRVLEEFEESVPDVGEPSEPIDKDEAGEGV
jgi:DNA-binding ferritin-like protein